MYGCSAFHRTQYIFFFSLQGELPVREFVGTNVHRSGLDQHLRQGVYWNKPEYWGLNLWCMRQFTKLGN